MTGVQTCALPISRQNESFKISPGTFKAYIKVGDRKAVTLNEINRNQVVMLNKMEISKITNGIISYANIKHKELEVPLINEIGTPKGGEYQIILSDGTKVWLNSASSIKFPSRFVGDARRVVLKGEAYFEVSKNAKMPFYVNTDKTEVKVIGTSFNVRAYDDERIIKTTLLEGSVQLRVHAIKVLLKPGEQGAVSVTNQIAVGDVNVEDEIAWKNGVFAFNDQNIQTIMSDISRWYDVDVVFQNPNMKKKFYGKVSKYKDVKQVLRKLSLTGAVHFKTEGRRITVME